MSQLITRKFEFDAGHRVMNERMKCFSAHGHRYVVELTFLFSSSQEIGYAIDFKEIKRVGCQWIDDFWDHGFLLNPEDLNLIQTLELIGTKIWLMTLNGTNYCNPTVENMAKELFLVQEELFSHYLDLSIHSIRIYETPNCWTDCSLNSISNEERENFLFFNRERLQSYVTTKGTIEYDDRKIN